MTEYEVCQQNTMACEQEIAKGIIGQKDVIRQVMLALLAGGNVLLEGMPGLGKTMLVRTISQVCDLSFQRIQFTPDLMPSDVTGTNIIVKEEQKVHSGLKKDRFLPIWCWRMRSTGPFPAPSPPCWRLWRRGR